MLNKASIVKFLVVVAVPFGLIGACTTADKSPDEAYRDYRRQVAAGLTIEEEMSFFSSRNRQETEASIAAKDPLFAPEWIEAHITMAKCSEIQLTSESVSADVALLTYDAVNICESTAGDTAKIRVRLVMENGWKIDHILLYDFHAGPEANSRSRKFLWRTDDITASIVHDDQSLNIGKYLHLVHKLAPGETGWQNKIINIPESWIVREILVIDGFVRLETERSGIFEVGRKNIGELMYEILDGGGDKPDNVLQEIWVRHAAIGS